MSVSAGKGTELILVRGLPGSGKSTLARRLTGFKIAMVSAEDFFVTGGEYSFDGSKIAEAHEQCMSRTWEAMTLGCDVVVHNTFSQRWEMQPYIAKASEFGYNLTVIDLYDNGYTNEALFERCVHGVPIKTIAKMRARWEHDWKHGSLEDPTKPRQQFAKEIVHERAMWGNFCGRRELTSCRSTKSGEITCIDCKIISDWYETRENYDPASGVKPPIVQLANLDYGATFYRFDPEAGEGLGAWAEAETARVHEYVSNSLKAVSRVFTGKSGSGSAKKIGEQFGNEVRNSAIQRGVREGVTVLMRENYRIITREVAERLSKQWVTR